MKFIVSLREPVSRTLSSWRFKALEHYSLQERRSVRTGKPIKLLNINDSIYWGERRAKCLSLCYHGRKGSMDHCSINGCRKKYDKYSEETKATYMKEEFATM